MLSQPYLVPINNRPEFELMEDYTYAWDEGKTKCRFTVRKGFTTDKASTPRFSWILGFTHDGMWDAAATIHDRLYQVEGRLNPDDPQSLYEEFSLDAVRWVPVSRILTRNQCDKLFLQIMEESGVTGWRAEVMYWAVHNFGNFAW